MNLLEGLDLMKVVLPNITFPQRGPLYSLRGLSLSAVIDAILFGLNGSFSVPSRDLPDIHWNGLSFSLQDFLPRLKFAGIYTAFFYARDCQNLSRCNQL